VLEVGTHRPDDGGSKNLWNVGKILSDYNPQDSHLHTRRRDNLKSYDFRDSQKKTALKKLRENLIRGMLATMQLRVVRLAVCYLQTIILPVDLYGCETWSLTLREGHRLVVFENSVLRDIRAPEGSSDKRLEKTA
jgi:hypothetical protein